jgi:Uma2 family endonuclease
MASSQPRLVTLRYSVAHAKADWTLREEPVPESRPHYLTATLVREILEAWAGRSGRSMQVGANLAVRWVEERPAIGVDPDVYVVEPPPPEGDQVTSLRLWQPGHAPPLLAVEVVSANHPHKDYLEAPDKYAASGTNELWIFDPELAGPHVHGGPHRLQVWCREATGAFSRVYAGPGPVRSDAVGGWLFAVDEGRRLRIADDEHGSGWWMTEAESERHAREREREAKERERDAKEAAVARVAELEAELARRARG